MESATALESFEHVTTNPVGQEYVGTNSPGEASIFAKPLEQSRIVIVDDEELNLKLVQEYLSDAGYNNFVPVIDSTCALEKFRDVQPDLVLLETIMPYVDGFQILEAMASERALRHIPVIVLTTIGDAESKLKALKLGATDFLAKPVDPSELVQRIHNTLAAKAYQNFLEGYSLDLEKQVSLRTAELVSSRERLIHCLARAAEYRDDDTGYHVIRVGRYAGIIAREIGFAETRARDLELAAQLHDIGKIGVPDSILLSTGKLDFEQFETMQRHCTMGKSIIQPLAEVEQSALNEHTKLGARMLDLPKSPLLTLAARIALTHHEHWDGSGYPLGLAAEDIPIEGRITAVADVYDALSTKRPYKKPFSRKKCYAILKEGRGTHFDPDVLDAFFARAEEVINVQMEYADPSC